MIPHAFHYSIASQRKRECPPSEFYQNPMWDNYEYYSKYFSRISTIITDSVHVADIALLYPMESLWADYVTATTERLPWDINDDFSYLTDKLLRINMDYDILGQDIFEDCKIENGKLCIRDEKYSVLIIPPMTTLRDNVAKKIISFIKNGGKVLCLSMMPYKNNEGLLLKELNNFFDGEFDIKFDELTSNYKNGKENIEVIESRNFKKENLQLINCGPLYKSNPIDYIKRSLEEMIEKDINITFLNNNKGNVYYSHWKKENRDFYFIVNSEEKQYKLEISFRNIGKPYLWSPETGKIEPLNVYKIEGNRLIVQYNPEKLESNFIVLEDEPLDKTRVVKTNMTVLGYRTPESKKISIMLSGNGDGERYIDLLDNDEVKHIKIELEPDKIFNFGNKWIIRRNNPNVLVVKNWKMKQGFSEGVGWFNMLGGTVFIESDFYVKDYGRELKAIFDRVPEPNEIEINGCIIKDFEKSTYLDHQLKEADLKKIIKKGINTIRIKFELRERAFQGKTGIKPIEIMYDPVLIIGDFKLTADNRQDNGYVIEKEDSIINTGTWTEQGYPYFRGSIELSQRIYVEEDMLKEKRAYIKSDDLREIVELQINGKKAGTRLWDPYIFDATEYLVPGENVVTFKIWNTLTNLLDLKIFDAGIISKPYILFKEIKNLEF